MPGAGNTLLIGLIQHSPEMEEAAAICGRLKSRFYPVMQYSIDLFCGACTCHTRIRSLKVASSNSRVCMKEEIS